MYCQGVQFLNCTSSLCARCGSALHTGEISGCSDHTGSTFVPFIDTRGCHLSAIASSGRSQRRTQRATVWSDELHSESNSEFTVQLLAKLVELTVGVEGQGRRAVLLLHHLQLLLQLGLGLHEAELA